MTYQQNQHIFAGQFKVGKEETDIYQACLGTCLGVALYDQQNKVGGIIHILLPEPPGISSVDYPEKYASTAMPFFIEELINLGAYQENLKATIAGGALVGPVTRQDINLDIGGRSADIVTAILKTAGIKIIKSETGGFFACTLEMDMTNGETHIKPAWVYPENQKSDLKSPSLDDILQTIGELKPVPQTALKIFRMFQAARFHINDITSELAKDQVLSAQTLKLCNSALFAGMIQIETLKDAVILMGENTLVKTIITAAVNAYYNQSETSGYSLCRGGLFFHALGVAVLAEKIAEKSKSPHSKIAYTAGLLHDIGKVVLDQYIADSAPLLFRRLSKKNEDFLTAEKKLLGINHCETGALLAKKWNFSDSLSEAIQYHHAPEKAQHNKELTYIIHLADMIVEKFCVGFDLEKNSSKNFITALKHCNISIEDIPELVDAIPIDAFKNEDILNL